MNGSKCVRVSKHDAKRMSIVLMSPETPKADTTKTSQSYRKFLGFFASGYQILTPKID
jgi:hypothetical protein